jgi:hypothetical protein
VTDTSAPFDGEGRGWAEAQWYRHMPAAMPSGVIGSPAASAAAGALAFSSSALNVTIGVGDANVGGSGFERTGTPAATAVPPNTNATLARRDRIVLRRDLGAHDTYVHRISGTPSGSPVAPDITRDSTTFDLRLFSFLVPANSGTAITGVIDERVWVNPAASGDSYSDEGSGTSLGLTTTPTAPSWTPSVPVEVGTYRVWYGGHFAVSVSSAARQLRLHLHNGATELDETSFAAGAVGDSASRDHMWFRRVTLTAPGTLTIRASADGTGGTQALTTAWIEAMRVS